MVLLVQAIKAGTFNLNKSKSAVGWLALADNCDLSTQLVHMRALSPFSPPLQPGTDDIFKQTSNTDDHNNCLLNCYSRYQC